MQAERRILNYWLHEELGHDRLGRVFVGEDARTAGTVVVRLLRVADVAPANRLDVARAGLRKRIRGAAAAVHPNIAAVLDFVTEGDLEVLTVEHVRGPSIVELIAAGKLLAPDEVLRHATAVADGLAAAHARHVTHGRISAANIRIGRDGVARLLDLGIPRPTEVAFHLAGVSDGDPEPVERRRDVHALARTIRAMVVGTEDASVLRTLPMPAGVRGEILRAVTRVLALPDPEVTQLREALTEVARSTPADVAEAEAAAPVPLTPPAPRAKIAAERDPPRAPSEPAPARPPTRVMRPTPDPAPRPPAPVPTPRPAPPRDPEQPAPPPEPQPAPPAPRPVPEPEVRPKSVAARVRRWGRGVGRKAIVGQAANGSARIVLAPPPRVHARKEVDEPRPSGLESGVILPVTARRSLRGRVSALGRAVGRSTGGVLARLTNRSTAQLAGSAFAGALIVVAVVMLLDRQAAGPEAPAEILSAADSTANGSTVTPAVNQPPAAVPVAEQTRQETAPAFAEERAAEPPVAPSRPERGTLRISVSTSGARVSLDGGPWRPAPVSFVDLPAGRYVVRVLQPGYRLRVDTVTVGAGSATRRAYTLTPETGL